MMPGHRTGSAPGSGRSRSDLHHWKSLAAMLAIALLLEEEPVAQVPPAESVAEEQVAEPTAKA